MTVSGIGFLTFKKGLLVASASRLVGNLQGCPQKAQLLLEDAFHTGHTGSI